MVSGCAKIIADLQIAQNDFISAHFTWKEKKTQEGLTPCATDVKKDVLTIINDKIVVYLNAMQQAKGALYGKLALTVSQIINDTNKAVKKRSKEEVCQRLEVRLR